MERERERTEKGEREREYVRRPARMSSYAVRMAAIGFSCGRMCVVVLQLIRHTQRERERERERETAGEMVPELSLVLRKADELGQSLQSEVHLERCQESVMQLDE